MDVMVAVDGVPMPGQLVTVRNRHWVAADIVRGSVTGIDPELFTARPEHLVTLVSVEDDARDEELRVVWELEPGTVVHESTTLPGPENGFDEPSRLAAFLHAVRWGAIASADKTALQAPFRSGIRIEDYQLDPVVRALSMPRTNLLIADDVGLGKTIEAGLVMQELMLRHRARTMLIVCPAGLTIQWRDEMRDKFGLDFRIVDADLLKSLRRSRGSTTNPWAHYPRLIVSVDWLKRDRPMRLLREILPPAPRYPRAIDLLVVDEVHTCAPSGRGRYAVDSLRTKAIREVAPHCEHRLFLSATPHNGYLESFTALLELLDNQRFARGVRPADDQLARIMVRRMKKSIPPRWDGTPRFGTRDLDYVEVAYSPDEQRAHEVLAAYSASRRTSAAGNAQRVASDFVTTLLKRSPSSGRACNCWQASPKTSRSRCCPLRPGGTNLNRTASTRCGRRCVPTRRRPHRTIMTNWTCTRQSGPRSPIHAMSMSWISPPATSPSPRELRAGWTAWCWYLGCAKWPRSTASLESTPLNGKCRTLPTRGGFPCPATSHPGSPVRRCVAKESSYS